MTVLISILAILFLTLIVGIPLIEKYSTEKSEEELARMSRYMVPLMFILIIGWIVRYFFF